MKRVLLIALGIAVAVTFVHDLGAYVNARRTVVEATRDAADVAAGVATSGRNEAAVAAVDTAAEYGVTVYLYNQDNTRVEVWGKIEVQDTWVYGPVTAVIENRPTGEPPVLENYATDPIR